jgi:hypothetical protein
MANLNVIFGQSGSRVRRFDGDNMVTNRDSAEIFTGVTISYPHGDYVYTLVSYYNQIKIVRLDVNTLVYYDEVEIASDYNGAFLYIGGFYLDDTYAYALYTFTPSGTTQSYQRIPYIYKYRLDDLSFVSSSTGTVGQASLMVGDDTYLYFVSDGKMRKYNKSNLSLVASSGTISYFSIDFLTQTNDYIFAIVRRSSSWNVARILKSTLGSVIYSNNFGSSDYINGICIDNNYIYFANSSVNTNYNPKIYKYNYNLQYVDDSGNIFGSGDSALITDMVYQYGYLYAVNLNNDVFKVDASDLTIDSLVYNRLREPLTSALFYEPPAYPPTDNTISNINCGGFDVTWINSSYYDSINIWLYDNGWSVFDVINGTDTGYTFNTLYSDKQYIIKIGGVYSGIEYMSTNNITTTSNAAPTGLTATTISYTTATLEWTLPCSGYGDNIIVQQYINGVWMSVLSLSDTAVSINLTDLRLNTEYTFRISALKGTRYNHGLPFTFRTLLPPPDFCSDKHYDITDSTCGSTGIISIDDVDYQLFYDFGLTDNFGNDYEFTGETINVPSGFYFLTATPKQEFAYYYKNTCGFDWLMVEDQDTTMTLTPVVRGTTMSYLISAGESEGRIYMDYTDSVTGLIHNYFLYTSNGEEKLAIYGSTGSTDFYLTPVLNGTYYAVIVNENGCKTLYPSIVVKNINSPFNLSGVKRVFISEYKDDIDYVTWKTSDEDFFVQALDQLKFQSAKIKSYVNPNQWYELPADIDTVFSQKLEKVRQGFVFRNTLDMTFSPSTYTKWLATKQLLSQRYIVVFEDLNGFWWTFGYDNQGALATQYSRKSEYNQYVLQFSSNSGDKILTAIDYEDYVLPYIINS